MAFAETAFHIKSRTVRRRSGRFFDELVRNERIPLIQLMDLQARRAAAIAQFAAANTAFYARAFAESGADLQRLDQTDEWASLPVVDRSMAKEFNKQFISTESTPKTVRDAKTGGSSGEPLRLQQDARVPALAMAWRMYRWWGVEPWHDLARIGRWGFGRVENLKTALAWWPSRHLYMDARIFDESSMREFYRKIVRLRPALIEGYVGAMTEFAKFLDAEGLRVPAPMAVATTAAPLTANVRRLLEGTYGAPVYDEYRGSEVNWMAGECGVRDGLHISADTRRIEILGPDNQPVPYGVVGDVVVTDLMNRVFPMIRYRVGDRAALVEGACPCGVTLPRMTQVEGRTTDIVRLPSGKMINHGILAMFADHPDAVRQFQVVQAKDHTLDIRIVRGDNPRAEEHIDDAVARLRQRIENEVTVTVRYVDDLPSTGGKTKYLISEVGDDTSSTVNLPGGNDA